MVTLLLGDCREKLAELSNDSVDLIFADPPYRLSDGGVTCSGGKMASVDKGAWDRPEGPELDFEFHRSWIAACRRVLKPEGSIWISGTYHSIYMCGYALQQLRFEVLNEIAWYKPNAAPNLSCRRFTASHETLIWARKGLGASHRFDYQMAKTGDWVDPLKAPGKQMRSVWSIGMTPPSERVGYPTQKPLALLRRIILLTSQEGDLVVDPFVGSGTTAVVAASTGRRFVGIDQSPECIEMTQKRLDRSVSWKSRLS